MRVYKISIVILLLHCGGYDVCYASVNVTSNKKNHIPPSSLVMCSNFIVSVLLWKLCPVLTLTKYSLKSEKCYGMSNGLGYYPKFLCFKKGNLKIGFLFFEHRTFDLFPKFVHLMTVHSTDWFEYLVAVVVFPLSLSILSIRWKCLRVNMFSILEIMKIRNYETYEEYRYYWSSFSFATNNFLYKTYLCWLMFLFPRLSIDISYFNHKL